jgi:hypothetical protein
MSEETPTTTDAPVVTPIVSKPPLKQRLARVMHDYPKVALYTYLALSLTAIIGFSLAIGLGLQPSNSSGVIGTIIAGWAAAKLTLPIRAIATIALTPLIAAYLARKKPTAAP